MERMDSTSEASVGTSVLESHKPTSKDAWQTAFAIIAGKTCDAGPVNICPIDSIPHEKQECTSCSAYAEAECGDSNGEPLPSSNIENFPLADTSASNAYVFKNCSIPEVPTYTKQIDGGRFAHNGCIPHENAVTYNNIVSAQTLDSKSTNFHSQSLEAKKELSDKFTIISSQPLNEQRKFSLSASIKDKSLIGSSLKGNLMPSNVREGKNRVFNAGGSKSNSLESDSRQSAESGNSRDTCSKGKRVRSYGQETLTGRKRLCKSIDKGFLSRTHVRKGSSFMNWVSSVTNGFFGSESSDLVDKHSHDHLPHLTSNTSNYSVTCCHSNDADHHVSHRGLGFGSMFRNMYCPRLGKPIKTVSSVYLQEKDNFGRLHFNNRSSGSVEAAPLSHTRNVQQGLQFSEPLPSVPSIFLRNSSVEGKTRHNKDVCNLCNVGSSSSSFQYDSCSPSEGKDPFGVDNFELNKFSSSSTMKKAHRSHPSLWITRFSSKVAASTPYEELNNVNPKMLHSQNGIISVKDAKHPKDARTLFGDLTDSYGSRMVQIDPKTKLNPTLSSQTVKCLEPMASVFAKRLDAFRHINASEINDNSTPNGATCFFCGKIGHDITSCLEVKEYEIKNLIEQLNSYGGIGKSSCVCIRCFRHGHWAIECTNASLTHHDVNGNTSDSNSRARGNMSDTSSEYCATGTYLKDEHMKDQFFGVHGSTCEEIPGTMQNSCNMDVLDMNNLDWIVSRQFSTRDCYNKTEAKGKQIASTSVEIGSSVKPLSQSINLNEAVRCLVFDKMRRLRLTRRQITRWVMFPSSHSSLLGFYLRVRIGKWKGDLEGTEYRVACINGVSAEEVPGHSNGHLSVDIGGMGCFIDCRVISNDDFVEDELEAWWRATLRRGGRLPSEAELDEKLRVREKLFCL